MALDYTSARSGPEYAQAWRWANDVPVGTPFLAMDEEQLRHDVNRIRRAFTGTTCHFAVKSNPSHAVLQALVQSGWTHFEIASLPELSRVTAVGALPSDVVYSNPVKPVDHIQGAYDAGVSVFAADSESEVDKLAEFAPGCRVHIRLNVDGGDSVFPLRHKFGVDTDAATSLLQRCADSGLVPEGLSFHVGSQCLDPQAWVRAIIQCAAVLRRVPAPAPA